MLIKQVNLFEGLSGKQTYKKILRIAFKIELIIYIVGAPIVFNWKQRTTDELETVPIFTKSFLLYPQIFYSFLAGKLLYNLTSGCPPASWGSIFGGKGILKPSKDLKEAVL